jgi:hypothetical protein
VGITHTKYYRTLLPRMYPNQIILLAIILRGEFFQLLNRLFL